MTRTFGFSRGSGRATLAVVAVTMTALFLISSNARADHRSVELAPSIEIKYSSGAVATDKGAAELYRRLKSAARSVCDALDGRSLSQRVAARKCFEESLEKAVYQVNMQPLTALHVASTREVG